MARAETAGSVEPKKQGGRTGRVLMIAGASLVALGVLALVGVSVYVWSTNSYTRDQQKKLLHQWATEKALPAGAQVTQVAPGAPVARIQVPRLNLDAIVVQLASMDDRENLNRGPGHVPPTAFPGMPGNVFIAGHRTTYGAPFGGLDQMQNGDRIILTTTQGKYVYSVTEQRIVDPHDMSVLDQQGEPRVTLMACHPKFTANQRILVIGRLTGGKAH
jgi:sortase A